MSRPITPHTPASPLICNEFRRGRGYTNWRPRGSGDWLLIFTAGGAGRLRLGDSVVVTEPGDAVLFAPTAEQDYATAPDPGFWNLRWAHFTPKPEWRAWLRWPEIYRRVGYLKLRGRSSVDVGNALRRMLTARRLGGPLATKLAMNALEEVLIRADHSASVESGRSIDARVQRAADYLAAHPSQAFRMDELVAHCALSASRLGHLFRAALGTTPQAYSEQVRLNFARQLLTETNLPIGEIAGEVGFADPLYFSRRYRRVFGSTPRSARATPAAE